MCRLKYYFFCSFFFCLFIPSLLVAQSVEVINGPATDEQSSESNGEFDIEKNINVRIKLSELKPSHIEVKPGTTVIWINDLDIPVKVKFLSEVVSTTCKAPRGFVLGHRGIYESKKIKGGGVASLCFLEHGNYDYKIQFINESEAANLSLNLDNFVGVIDVHSE